MTIDFPSPLASVVKAIDVPDLALRESGLVMLDARGGTKGREEFEKRRVAGAQFVDLESDLAGDASQPENGGRHPLPGLKVWCGRLGEWGIDPETAVVVYDNAGGGNAAARAWWMVRATGHRRVALLDGGLAAAAAARLPLESGAPVGGGGETSQPKGSGRPYPAKEWDLPIVDADEVERRRQDPDWRVVDVRSAERYRGESEPFDPIPGRIPGTVNLPWTDLIDEAGVLLDGAEIEQRLEQAVGDVPPERTIVHCGSGVTACHTLLALEHVGRSGSALYVGSWSEWCRQPRPRLPDPADGEPSSEE